MSVTRTSGPFYSRDFRQIQKKRIREAAFKILVDFLSAVGTLICIFDAASIIGLPIAIAGLTLGTILFFSILGLAVIGGALWAAKKAREYEAERKKEMALMTSCNSLLQRNQALHQDIALKYPDKKFQFQTGLEDLEQAEPMTFKRFVMKAGNRIMAFLSGAGTTLGISALVMGAIGISIVTLAATPLGWGVLAAVSIFAIGLGIAAVIVEYKLERAQEKRIKELKNEKKRLKEENTQLEAFDKQCEAEKRQDTLQAENAHLKSEIAQLKRQESKTASASRVGHFSRRESFSATTSSEENPSKKSGPLL